MNTEEKVIKFITNGSNRSLRRMLEENEIDLRSDTPSTQRILIAAIKNKNLEVLNVLLEYGIFTGGITIAPGKYGSLFTKAIYEKDTELMGILSKYPHTLNDSCRYDTEPTPLVYALENKLIKLAKKLIKLGANVNVKSEKYF